MSSQYYDLLLLLQPRFVLTLLICNFDYHLCYYQYTSEQHFPALKKLTKF